MGERDTYTPEPKGEHTPEPLEEHALVEEIVAFLGVDDGSKPEWQALNQQILKTQILQNECNTASHNLHSPERLRARYRRADQLLQATNLVLGFDPDTAQMTDPQAYLATKLNHALNDFGLEVALKKDKRPRPSVGEG